MTDSVRVSLENRSYNILIGDGLILKSGAIIKKLSIGDNAVIVTNSGIARLYAGRLQNSLKRCGIGSRIELVPDSETAKSYKVLLRLLNRIGACDKNRPLFLIALGGGVIGDLTGFAASIYKRGIPYVQIPTTLLSQVDSAIGGKSAIDLKAAKNLAGSFYQPKAVISDISVLGSLPARQIRNGLAECIKYGVIADKKLFVYLEKNCKKALARDRETLRNLVIACSRIKARVVEADEFDKKGRRVILNYGHTIGHAIENAAGYSSKYGHGEAVAIGMVCAARISSLLGLIGKSDMIRIESLIKKCGLPVKVSGLKASAIYGPLLRDKKFVRGKNRFVLPVTISKVRLVECIGRPAIIKSIEGRI